MRLLLIYIWLFIGASLLAHSFSVAVVGSGPAGLTAAYTLFKQGHKVTVFEISSEVGGKVSSFSHGGRIYEMGAVVTLNDYQTVFQLAKELNVPLKTESIKNLLTLDGRVQQKPEWFFSYYFGPLEALKSFRKLKAALKKFKLSADSGYAKASRELFLPMKAFAKKHRIESITETFKPYLVGCGYGVYEDVPALYYLKLIESLLNHGAFAPKNILNPFSKNKFKFFQEGFQSLWKAVAAQLDIRLNERIEWIKRSNEKEGGISLFSNGKQYSFDRLVVACPLNKSLNFLDASLEEKELFSKIKFYQYRTVLFKGSSIPSARTIGIYKNSDKDHIGHLVALIGRYANDDHWLAYQLVKPAQSDADLEKLLRKGVKASGGEIKQIISAKSYDYFPHWTTEDLKMGFYPRLEKLQGEQNTFYVGGLLNFESVESSASYAKFLMEKKFSNFNCGVILAESSVAKI